MQTLQRGLVICGVSLILSGLVFGIGFGFVADHASVMTVKDWYQPAFVGLSEGLANKTGNMSDHMALIESIGQRATQYRRAVGAHAHAINLGLVMIILGLILGFAFTDKRYAKWVAWALAVGGCVYPVGLVLQAFGLVFLGEAFSVMGAGLMLAGLGSILLVLFLKTSASSQR